MTLPLTPAMRQYVEIKSRYRDCILFFRMGDFYEMFFEDALRASRLLDIALTSRDKEANIPMCGVPHHARNAYLSKLIRQGCKVAICEQIEEPGQKGIFRREVTEVVTPGLVFNEECLDARGNNFLAAVRFVAPFACAALDATTGEFFHEACDTEEALADALFRIGPAEFVALEGEGNPTTTRGKRLLEGKLLTLLAPSAVAAFPAPPGIGGIPPADHPSGGVVRAALYYLFLHQPAALSEIGRVTEREGRRYLSLDETAVRTLEIFSTMSGERKGSLLWAWTARGPRWGHACCGPGSRRRCSTSSGSGSATTRWGSSSRRTRSGSPFPRRSTRWGISPGSPPAWRRTVPAPGTWRPCGTTWRRSR
jgi:DNA mismatch repair protein MutS